MPAFRVLAALCAAACLLAAQDADPLHGFRDLSEPRPQDADRPAELEGWTRVSCAKCHAETTREWAASTHAMAWVDPRYQEALADMKRPEACHGCHIPAPLHGAATAGVPPEKPAARALVPQADAAARGDQDAHHGVSCATCHEGPGGTILGPRGGATDAHPTKQDASFLPEGGDRLCISCHATSVGPVIGLAKDFLASDRRKGGAGCVDCHMRPLERPVAEEQGKPAYPSRRTRSHALQTPRDPAFMARAFGFEAARGEGDLVRLELVNLTGHRVPGLAGRELAAKVRALDAQGALVAEDELLVDRSSPVPADGRAALEFAAKGARRLDIELRHLGPGLDEPVLVRSARIDLP